LLSHGVTYVYDGYWLLIVPPGFCIVIVIAAAIFIGEDRVTRSKSGCSGAKAETETHGTAA
jgi:ABC-type dipeptide/oligopeptide/nickel transport system permease subunit